jgi:hypothetical protein
MSERLTAIPLTPNVARHLAEELFQNQSIWKRDALVAEVQRLHAVNGGILGKQDPVAVVKKALSNLQADGLVIKPYYGHWQWRDTTSEYNNTNTLEEIRTDLEETNDEDEPTASEKILGEGPECIYLYFNPNDRKLAHLEGRNVWECKIGRTASLDSGYRILSQGAKTALSHPPIVGLVIRTDDSFALEKALHASLRLVDAQVADSPGVEWFMTSPSLVEAWHEGFQALLKSLIEGDL